MRKTKIVCTLGPASEKEEVLREMILAGMDVARFNFSHGAHEEHKRRMDTVKKLRAELHRPVAIMLDTKGPELRLGTFKEGKVQLNAGDIFTLTTRKVEGTNEEVSISYDIIGDISKGARIMLDDGLIELTVVKLTKTDIVCEVINSGVVSNHKSLNLPGVDLTMPFLSDRDKEDILFGISCDVDLIATSFTRRADDVKQVKEFLEKNGGGDIGIIAKIENLEGCEKIEEILNLVDGIMVARGDLGVEVPFEDLPRLQKELIKKGYRAGKRVITATQMLESMINNPRPTRAEISDVANAIYDGTSAIMLSGETSVGKYPVEVVKTMATIAIKTEENINYRSRFESEAFPLPYTVTSAISHATCTTAHDLGAVAIINVTKSGETAKMISKHRPECPIISFTTSEKVYNQLALSWGVEPLMIEELDSTDRLFERTVQLATEAGYLESGDLVVITAGVPLGISGTTNLLKVHLVGHILVSGIGSMPETVCGNLCVAADEAAVKKHFKDGDILVTFSTDNTMLPAIKKAKALIVEDENPNCHAVVAGMTLDIPVIYAAKNATKILKSGTTVIVDGAKGIVRFGA